MSDTRVFHIQLELGPEPQHPFGERGRLYDLYLPLRPDGSVDAEALHDNHGCCRGRRLRNGHQPVRGRIELADSGALLLKYDGVPLSPSVVALDDAPVAVGRCIPVAEADGQAHPYQVISVRNAWA
jgi:hypothetical protein